MARRYRRKATKAGRVPEPALAPTAPGRPMPAGVFKARCLELMDLVQQHGGEIVITKYGRPVAKLVPLAQAGTPLFGALAASVEWTGDLLTPVEPQWHAAGDG